MPDAEPMPVLWAAARTRAHLMHYDLRGARMFWRSRCGWDVRRSFLELGGDAARGEAPGKPWCSGCLRIVGRTIAGYAAAGMLGELHAFTEHIADGSVCVCGRPASAHRVGRYAG